MKIFDCHCHIEAGFENYTIPVIGRNIIFNTVDSYHENHTKLSEEDALTLIFDYQNNLELIQKLMKENKLNALKIHSRLQKISEDDYPLLIKQLEASHLNIPVVIDAFYHGDEYEYQPNLKYIIKIAKRFPDVPIIVAHAGGYNVLKYFYHLKSLDNIYFDLSFSLAYLKNASVFADFKNLIRFGNENKILFGTDHPFANVSDQLNTLLSIFKEMAVSDSTATKILFSNSFSVFKK